MKATKTPIIFALLLGIVPCASAGEIVVVNSTGSLDIPDNDRYAASYLIGSAPSAARVTWVPYEVLVDDRGTPSNFWCSDYEIGLSSTTRGGAGNYLLVWDNAGGQTDGNADDDVSNDSDIDLSRSTSAFHGQTVNQRWYLSIEDNVSHAGVYKGVGSLKQVILSLGSIQGPHTISLPEPGTRQGKAPLALS